MTDRFARWLDIMMENRGIKGRSLAKQVGVHDSAVSRWRSGQGVPSLDTTMKLAKIMDVDPMRLAVTVGHMSPADAHVEPLELPTDEIRRDNVRRQIKKIKGVDRDEVAKLLETYDQMKERT